MPTAVRRASKRQKPAAIATSDNETEESKTKTPQQSKALKANIVARGYESESIDSQSTSGSTVFPHNFGKKERKKASMKRADSRGSFTVERSPEEGPVKDTARLPAEEKRESKYGPTKIKIWHPYEPSDDIKDHPINKMFKAYNGLVRLLFARNVDYEQVYKEKLPRILKYLKVLGLQPLKNQLLPSNLKNRDQANLLKEKIVQCICRTIANTNIYTQETSSFFTKKVDDRTK